MSGDEESVFRTFCHISEYGDVGYALFAPDDRLQFATGAVVAVQQAPRQRVLPGPGRRVSRLPAGRPDPADRP